MPYTVPIEPSLNALDRDKPEDQEPFSDVPSCIRQTRNWLHDFLARYFDPLQPLIRQDAITVISPGSIRGSNPVSREQREIAQGSIRAIDIAQRAIEGQHIQKASLEGDCFSNLVGESFATEGVGGSNLAAGFTLEAGQVIETVHLKDEGLDGSIFSGGLSGRKFGARSIGPLHLPEGTSSHWLIGGQTVGELTNCLAPVQVRQSLFEIDPDGTARVTPSALGRAIIVETTTESASFFSFSTGAEPGVSANTWFSRPASGGPSLEVVENMGGIVELEGTNRILIKKNGTYFIYASVPFGPATTTTAVQSNMRISYLSQGGTNFIKYIYGLGSAVPTSTSQATGRCRASAIVSFANVEEGMVSGSEDTRCHIRVQQIVNTTSTHFGRAYSVTGEEITGNWPHTRVGTYIVILKLY